MVRWRWLHALRVIPSQDPSWRGRLHSPGLEQGRQSQCGRHDPMCSLPLQRRRGLEALQQGQQSADVSTTAAIGQWVCSVPRESTSSASPFWHLQPCVCRLLTDTAWTAEQRCVYWMKESRRWWSVVALCRGLVGNSVWTASQFHTCARRTARYHNCASQRRIIGVDGDTACRGLPASRPLDGITTAAAS
jgi:hypothetical protein